MNDVPSITSRFLHKLNTRVGLANGDRQRGELGGEMGRGLEGVWNGEGGVVGALRSFVLRF